MIEQRARFVRVLFGSMCEAHTNTQPEARSRARSRPEAGVSFSWRSLWAIVERVYTVHVYICRRVGSAPIYQNNRPACLSCEHWFNNIVQGGTKSSHGWFSTTNKRRRLTAATANNAIMLCDHWIEGEMKYEVKSQKKMYADWAIQQIRWNILFVVWKMFNRSMCILCVVRYACNGK